MRPPETHFASGGDHRVAYQVLGSGPADLVFVSSWFSHVDAWWEFAPMAAFLQRLAGFTRLILFDKRGCGASDVVPPAALPTLEEWAEDVTLVMDEVGIEHAALLGTSDGTFMTVLFATTHPERTSALIIANGSAKATSVPDYPWAVSPEAAESYIAAVDRSWGTSEGVLMSVLAPSLVDDSVARAWFARYQRMSASPTTATALWRMIAGGDVRGILGAVRVRTLILHRTDNAWVPIGGGRYLAEHIPDARFVNLPGADHWIWVGDTEPLIEEIEEFLTGARHDPGTDRFLTTMLFADIVSSSERTSTMGDRAWREILDRFHTAVCREVERFRGRVVNTRGDDFLSTFDGPARALRCAKAVREAVDVLRLDIRVGLHTGEVERRGEDITGLAVNLAARVMGLAGPGEVLVTSTVKELVSGSGIPFEDRGLRQLRGIPGAWHVYALAAS